MSICSNCYTTKFRPKKKYEVGHWWNNEPYLAVVCSDKCKDELEKRSKEWRMPKPNYESGALSKYEFLVGSAADGATTDPDNFLKMSKHLRDNMLTHID